MEDRLFITNTINNIMRSDDDFASFVTTALHRYSLFDWGELVEEDIALNRDALEYGGRIMGVYALPQANRYPDDRLWIITEYTKNHSEKPSSIVTTILFPFEY